MHSPLYERTSFALVIAVVVILLSVHFAPTKKAEDGLASRVTEDQEPAFDDGDFDFDLDGSDDEFE